MGVGILNNILETIKKELKDFFFDNKGKFYCMVVAIGAILVIITFILNFCEINKKAKIELVDTSIIEDGDSTSIDIKVRNTGDSVAYLYCVKVYVLDSFQMREIYNDTCDKIQSDTEVTDKKDYEIKYESVDSISIELLPDKSLQNEIELVDNDIQKYNEENIEEPVKIGDLDEEDIPLLPLNNSLDYFIELSNEKEQEFNISQVVYSNDVDRFTLILTDDGKQNRVPSVKCIYIEIYYNKNDYVSTSKMVIPLNVDNMIYDRNIPEINLENAKENYEMLLKFNYYTDVIRSEKYNLLLTGYEDNKNDF